VNEGVVDLLVDGESVAIQLTDLDKANIDY
jgi:hypothetical protein